MNDPARPAEAAAEARPVTPAEADAEAAAAVGNFGAALRAAREAAGISVATLAGRLRLHVKQIDALERCDLAALPTLIYVRGFVRSCARELKIDVAPLLDDLDRRAGVVPGAPLAPAGGGMRLARLGDGSRSVVALALAILVIAGVIGTLWPRRASVPPKAAVTEAPAPVATPAPAPGPAGGPVDGEPVAAPAPVPAPATLAPPPRPPAVTAPLRTPGAKGAAAHPVDADTGPVAPPAVVAEAPAAPPPPLDDGTTLTLHVHGASWVEVVQANGTSVFSQICPAGSVQTVHGTPPLRVVVGNAVAVEAQYRGAAVDLNKFANANGVARLTLQ